MVITYKEFRRRRESDRNGVGSTADTLMRAFAESILGTPHWVPGDFGIIKISLECPDPPEENWTLRLVRENGTGIMREIPEMAGMTFSHPTVQKALWEIRQELEAGAK